MADKGTGFEKFTKKNKSFEEQSSFSYGGRIKIARPAHVDEEVIEQNQHAEAAPAAEPELTEAQKRKIENARIQAEPERLAAQPKRGKGRPKISEEEKMDKTIINFQVSRELKMKLEELRIKTYRPSITGVMIEAINDILKKYGME